MAETAQSKATSSGPEPKAAPMFMPDFDFTKAFSAMKIAPMPGMDVVLGAYRRNLEALSEANRVALEGAQAVARRHMEIMQRTMTDLSEQMRGVDLHDTPQARATKQAELLKHAYETAVANMRDLGDLIQRSNQEAVEKLNRRFSEAMDEMKNLIDKKS
ncbi:phasin family protein [Acidiphilium sp.]|uniref:phasin family protein n=1 Tax=Acidiphilium sp. TaxID=527 RepID=UPI003D040D17